MKRMRDDPSRRDECTGASGGVHRAMPVAVSPATLTSLYPCLECSCTVSFVSSDGIQKTVIVVLPARKDPEGAMSAIGNHQSPAFPDIESLSMIIPSPTPEKGSCGNATAQVKAGDANNNALYHDEDLSYQRIPIFGSLSRDVNRSDLFQQTESHYWELRKNLQRIRGLSHRLERAILTFAEGPTDSASSNKKIRSSIHTQPPDEANSHASPAQNQRQLDRRQHVTDFSRRCDCVFAELRSAMEYRQLQLQSGQTGNTAEPTMTRNVEPLVTADFFQWSVDTLQELDSYISSKGQRVAMAAPIATSFVLANDCQSLDLVHHDAAGREHKITIDMVACYNFSRRQGTIVTKPTQKWTGKMYSFVNSIVSGYFPNQKHMRDGDRSTGIVRKRKPDGLVCNSDDHCYDPIHLLEEICRAFETRIHEHQDLYNELEILDKAAVVLDPPVPRHYKHAYRRLQVVVADTKCPDSGIKSSRQPRSLLVELSCTAPRSNPVKLQWFGLMPTSRSESDVSVDQWDPKQSILENLQKALERETRGNWKLVTLADKGSTNGPSDSNTGSVESNTDGLCAICFSESLAENAEEAKLEPTSSRPTIECLNPLCHRVYHEFCLRKWLSTCSAAQSFDYLLGDCPYCQERISVPL